ncbi:alpha/beta hydrolase-fold protein [Mucilaginibacter sp. KACC 22773]|uniref:alpha/beta hydrolase n=1 Tax=Mucilaginibacter sp. KACC 22773 TaxID=3025671 RepID=UPI0023656301|nr:alpha/beta hydrolase-fold protein [Mucilaginibacter sp. KACC 22773]WDF78765.1 alpha/beta hydrolase-fold protein [Mucilaginibacter sp. KACC 22773]
MNWGWVETEMTIIEKRITINSALLEREVLCTLLIPDEQEIAEPLSLLLLNDGQELENLELSQTLEKLYNTNRLKPIMIAAIYAGEDRLQEYGVAGRPDFKKRGAKADIYTQFIITELLPQIKAGTGIHEFENTAFAGFSLGGLSAFDICWNNADVFDKVGVFSGSFWWRSKDLAKGYTDNDRIAHTLIRETEGKPGLKFWLQTGTKDETSDRNKNGIIDAIDDTIDLIKELEAKGFSRPSDIQYVEVVGGSHNTETWGRVMGKFLCWAFGV